MNKTDALENFKNTVSETLSTFPGTLTEDFYSDAVKLILESKDRGGRVHFTGIGKPSHVAEYIASLLSSMGTPSYYLNATEAVHGSSGQLAEGDIVVCISNSGNTDELKPTVNAIHNNGCKVIGVSGNSKSWLAEHSDVFLSAHVDKEGSPMGRAPMASVLAEEIVLQGLCCLLELSYGWTPEQYVKRHPGGALGKL